MTLSNKTSITSANRAALLVPPRKSDGEPPLPSTEDWKLSLVDDRWERGHDAETYQRTISRAAAGVVSMASKVVVTGGLCAAGATAGIAFAGFAGVAGLAVAGAAVLGALVGDLAMDAVVARKATNAAGSTIGEAMANVAQRADAPLRNDLVAAAADAASPASISGTDADRLISQLRPGDIVLTGDERSVPVQAATRLVSGRASFTHALLYQGDGVALEATTRGGVAETDLRQVLTGKHHTVALRPDYHKGHAEKAVEAARERLGLPYDMQFTLGNKALYCSELVHESLLQAAPEIEFATRKVLGHEVVLPNDLYYTQDASVVGEFGRKRSYSERLMSPLLDA